MHTFKASNGTVFLYNSDLSGPLVLNIDKSKVENIDYVNPAFCHVELSPEDVLEFVADFIRNKKIAELEQMSTDDILKL